MNRKHVLSLFVMITVILSSSLTSASAQTSVGVSVGQSFEITYGYSGTIRYGDGTLNSTLPYYVETIETNTITAIDGTNITFRSVRDYLNGTKTFGNYWIDTSTGDGTAWLVAIAPNVETGAMLYPNWVNENYTTNGAFKSNSTVQLYRGNEVFDAVHLQRMFMTTDQTSYYNYNYYWEKSTGLLIECNLASALLNEEDELVQTLNTHLHSVGVRQTFYPYVDNSTAPVNVDSQSALIGFEFDETQKSLSLTLTGATGTSGHCDVWVPASFLKGPFTLEMDDYDLVKGTDYTLTYNGTHYKFGIDYIHSTHTIDIVASELNPEDPTPAEEIDPEPTEPEPTEPEPNEETPFLTTEMIVIIVAVVCVIGLIAYFALRKRK